MYYWIFSPLLFPQTAGRWEAQPANAFMLRPELSKQWMKNGLTSNANCQLLRSTSVGYSCYGTNRFTWTVGDLKLHLKFSEIIKIAEWWLSPRGVRHIMYNGPKSIQSIGNRWIEIQKSPENHLFNPITFGESIRAICSNYFNPSMCAGSHQRVNWLSHCFITQNHEEAYGNTIKDFQSVGPVSSFHKNE